MKLSITCVTGDADHFYNTILMIAKGFEIGVIESHLGPDIPKEEVVPPLLTPSQQEKKKAFFSIMEASEYLKLSKHTLYKILLKKRFPIIKLAVAHYSM